MSSLNQEHGYWRSLRELAGQTEEGGDYEGAPMEFAATANDQDAPADPMSRRNFVQIMGASMALAGVAGAGCKRWEKDEIVPLARRPEDQIPGVPQRYATTWDFMGVGMPLVATSYEGRPIKVDGNPDHPTHSGGPITARHGATSAFAQATILDLYDPDRSKLVMENGQGKSFADFSAWLKAEEQQLRSSASRIRVLSEASSSPTVARLKEELRQHFQVGKFWYEWEPLSHDNERAGTRLAFGRPVRPLANLKNARTIVCLDCDLFVEHPAALRYSRDWSLSRKFGVSTLGDGAMNRLYAVESSFTSTGAVADHRLPIRSEMVLPFAMALQALLTPGGTLPKSEFTDDDKIKRHLEAIADELRNNRSAGVVLAGRRQPKEVHAIVAKINELIGAVGSTLEYRVDPDPERPDHLEGLKQLVGEIEGGQVDYLFIVGGNPVYDAPADLDFTGAMAQVKRATVHLSLYEDETSKVKSTGEAKAWHVPRAHYLESWGDSRAYDGVYTLAQPLIQPMYGGISTIELLQMLLGQTPNAMEAVQATFNELRSPMTWRQAVHDGFVPNTQLALDNTVQVGNLPMIQLSDTQKLGMRLPKDSVEVTFCSSTNTWDGRFANNGWLQEMPDFLTKVTWDNYAMVGPATAKELGLANDTMLKIVLDGRELQIACYTMPGQAPYSIGVVLGGGRTAAGSKGGLGKKTVGFDSYKIRTSKAFDIASGAKVTSTGTGYQLASTQEHFDISAGLKKDIAQKGIADRLFKLVEEARLEETQSATWRAQDAMMFPNINIWDEENTDKYPAERVHKWGMAIDLSSCTGCNACTVACYAENNIPVVGKAQVIWNREMSWLRIDRYFSGSTEDPQIVHQPLGCVHCENAPCETVCPVGATLHSSEGLNDMVYNRCIGTRYCLNNCSYRVRRFNFFDYNKEFKEARNQVRRLLFNPEVTVRHRGVMEKCTYCVQRIQNAKISAKNEHRELIDGETAPQTACQEACPTQAIIFGDLNDPNSRVRRLHEKDRRAYEMLGELNTKPRTHHLARIRNPNPKLEQAHGHRGSH